MGAVIVKFEFSPHLDFGCKIFVLKVGKLFEGNKGEVMRWTALHNIPSKSQNWLENKCIVKYWGKGRSNERDTQSEKRYNQNFNVKRGEKIHFLPNIETIKIKA